MKNLLTIGGLIIGSSTLAQPSMLDGDFNGDGLRIIATSGIHYNVRDVAVTASGRILVCGMYPNPVGMDGYIQQFNPDGSTDMTFGVNGRQIIDYNGGHDNLTSMIVQPDGKIIVAGIGSGLTDAMLCRLNSDGSFDNTFGNNSYVINSLGSGTVLLHDLVLQGDGKIVAVGAASATEVDIVVVRFNTDGTLDNSFSFDGSVTSDVLDVDVAYNVRIDADGKIVVAGYADDGISNADGVVIRYNADGTLDNSFGTSGKALLDFGTLDYIRALAISNTGKIIVAGYTNQAVTHTNVVTARLNQDGMADNGFSFDGKLYSDFFSDDDEVLDMVLQPDGKILHVGMASNSVNELALLRVNWDGSYDNTFGTAGKVTTALTSNGAWYATTLQADGKILTAGQHEGTTFEMVVGRYISGINMSIGEVDTYIGSTLVYPNPITNNQVTIEYELKSDERVSIELFDLSGKLMEQLQSSVRQKAGSYQKAFSLPTVAAGNYLMKLNTVTGSISVKITVN